MRKVFWCAAAGLVACATAVYFVADYAAKHPDSYWARCVNGAASFGLYANPFVHVTTTGASKVIKEVGQQVNGAGNAVAAQGAGNAQGDVARMFVGEQVLVNEKNFDVRQDVPLEDVLPFEPIKVEPMPADPIKDEGENWIFDGQSIPSFFPNETEEPRVGATEESELVGEDEMVGELAPMPMPYAEEECEPHACPGSQPSCDSWFWKLLRLGGLIRPMPVADDGELAPMPTPCDEETQEESTENQANEQIPDCQEDPAYHHHYHGCPYMGGCPYPYSRAVPVVTPIERQQPAPEQAPVKKKPVIEEGNGIKKIFWYGCDEESSPTGIDTMEFRPSDDPRAWPSDVPF
ncbi:MAG TPA: hypothetical protein VEL76_12660 [Gemmataceae bacterium]|nr:hypothetical protein [Gemmataceae bacterium]